MSCAVILQVYHDLGRARSPEELRVSQPLRVPRKLDGPYCLARCGLMPPVALLAGLDELNRGLYFDQHETLEALWRAEADDVRYLYQGILLIGVGLYHLDRGNRVGAKSKLRRGLELLRWFTPSCQGVDVERLVADASRLLTVVEALGSSAPLDVDRALYPRVWLLPTGASPGSPER